MEAEEQVAYRAGLDHRNGTLSLEQLSVIYNRIRGCKLVGFSKRWNANAGVKSVHLYRDPRFECNAGKGVWRGSSPLGLKDQAPRKGVFIVYILFDHDANPCYVGSTGDFRTRLKAHRRDKPVRWWTAYECPDRQGAYAMEKRLLQEHMPYLNRRAW